MSQRRILGSQPQFPLVTKPRGFRKGVRPEFGGAPDNSTVAKPLGQIHRKVGLEPDPS